MKINFVEDISAMNIFMGYFTTGTDVITFNENIAQHIFNLAVHLHMSADRIACLFQIVEFNLKHSKIEFQFQEVEKPAMADPLRSSFLSFAINSPMCLIEVEFEPVESVTEYAIEIFKCVGEDDVTIYQGFVPAKCTDNGRIFVEFDESILIYPNEKYDICLRSVGTAANFAQGKVFSVQGMEVLKDGKKRILTTELKNANSKFSKLIFYPVP